METPPPKAPPRENEAVDEFNREMFGGVPRQVTEKDMAPPLEDVDATPPPCELKASGAPEDPDAARRAELVARADEYFRKKREAEAPRGRRTAEQLAEDERLKMERVHKILNDQAIQKMEALGYDNGVRKEPMITERTFRLEQDPEITIPPKSASTNLEKILSGAKEGVLSRARRTASEVKEGIQKVVKQTGEKLAPIGERAVVEEEKSWKANQEMTERFTGAVGASGKEILNNAEALGAETLEKAKNIKAAIETRGKQLALAAERLGKGAFEKCEMIGAWYKEQPAMKKAALGVALAGFAIVGGAGVAAIPAIVWRGAGTAGMFVALQEGMKRKYEKDGVDTRSTLHRNLDTGGAAVASVLIGFFGTAAFSRIFEGMESVKEMVSKGPLAPFPIGGEGMEVQPVVPAAAPIASPVSMEGITGAALPDYAVAKGDNFYKILKANFNDIAELEGGRQTNAIENILAEMKKDPAAYGISSGNINDLKPGDAINLEKIREIIDTHQVKGESIAEHAKNLSEQTVQRIEGWSPVEVQKEVVTADFSGTSDARHGEFQGIEPGGEEQKPVIEGEIQSNTSGGEYEGITESVRTAEVSGNQPEFEQLTPDAYEKSMQYFENPEKGAAAGLSQQNIDWLHDARSLVHANLDSAFGKKSFLGLSFTRGIDSDFWQAWKGRSIEAVFAKQNPLEELEVGRLKAMATAAAKDSGLALVSTQNIERFLRGAALKIVSEGKYN
ncbi:hypothetical protein KW797_00995 [Candidatus Parcubacteria bacterium]|nr:hypothetical protein [Candidatus Parcubacteria bacterium]